MSNSRKTVLQPIHMQIPIIRDTIFNFIWVKIVVTSYRELAQFKHDISHLQSIFLQYYSAGRYAVISPTRFCVTVLVRSVVRVASFSMKSYNIKTRLRIGIVIAMSEEVFHRYYERSVLKNPFVESSLIIMNIQHL